MPISSFYGLQTSLRGLLAQQRALDTTGHNIANASTAGYSRQEAVLAASPALVIQQGAVQSGAGAHIGSGVDVQSYRRIRDTFLDLQYRAQATRLGKLPPLSAESVAHDICNGIEKGRFLMVLPPLAAPVHYFRQLPTKLVDAVMIGIPRTH